MSSTDLPLFPYEVKARNHGLLCSIAFLIILPVGTLAARYARTFTNKWFYIHFAIQFFIAGPIIYAGWDLGYELAAEISFPNFTVDIHQKIGLALLILYLAQVFIGALVHYFKFPTLLRGHRAPHNYLHICLGLAILALATFQVHYGLYYEWDFAVGGFHVVPQSAKSAWLALTVIFWALYGIGWALIPRQLRQEREYRSEKFGK